MLEEEIELRRPIGRVTELRRALATSSELSTRYRCLDRDGKEHGLADLVGRHDTLIQRILDVRPRPREAVPNVHILLNS